MADWDVTLNGNNYMLLPKSYHREIVGGPVGHSTGTPPTAAIRQGRTRIVDFSPGLNHTRTLRAAANDRAGLHSGHAAFPAVWPAPRNGVGAAPVRQATGAWAAGPIPRYHVADATHLYEVGPLADAYRWDKVIANAPVQRSANIGGTCGGLCIYGGVLYAATGATDLRTSSDGGTTWGTFAVGRDAYQPLAPEGSGVITYGGGIFAVDTSDLQSVRAYSDGLNTTTQLWLLGGQVINWCVAPDGLVIATTNGLVLFTGSWSGATNDFVKRTYGILPDYQSAADDFQWMLMFQGRLWVWSGKTAIWYDTARDVWHHGGLEGKATHGAAVVNNVLFVSIEPWNSVSTYELWANNGLGWWRIETSGTNVFTSLCGDGDGKLLMRQTGSSGNGWVIDMEDRWNAATEADEWYVVSPALDADHPDRTKDWTKIGAEFLRNDGQDQGSWDVTLSTSVDGGVTWVAQGSAQTMTLNVDTIDAIIAISTQQLMVKVSLTDNAGLTPHLVCIWADWLFVDEPGDAIFAAVENERRQQWTFKIPARDDLVNRVGAADTRTGQDIRNLLWALPASTQFGFRDVDYGATSIERSVRLVNIQERWERPADQVSIASHTIFEITIQEAD